MKLAVSGSRSITDRELVYKQLDIYRKHISLLILGDAPRGVDVIALDWAIENEVLYIQFDADWDSHPNYAGNLRNGVMISECDHLLAIWDGESTGTKDAIDKAHRAGRGLEVVTVSKRGFLGGNCKLKTK